MAPNKRKILEAARKYAQKGQKERSLKEYEKLLKLDPRDAKLRLEIGDAHRRWGQVNEAANAYTKVAEQYMAEGFDARAVAVFKQIQNLDPERYEAYVPLSELYERMGLTSEAIQALQTAADGFHKEGKKREALDLLRRMAGLDPSNTTSRIKVADLLRQEGLTEAAIAEYEAARAEFESQGEHEAAGGVLERILEADPERLETLVALAQNLLKRGQADAAEAMAKRALDKQEEPENFELLADVYRAQQRDDELKDTYKRLAELYRQRGNEDGARDIIQRFVPMDEFGPPLDEDSAPNDLDAGLPGGSGSMELPQPGGLDMPSGDDASDMGEELLEDEILMDQPVSPATDEPLAEETVLELGDEPEQEILLEEPSEPRGLDEELPPPPVEGDPDQLLAEASVYLRYGKRGQAIRNLEAVVEREPTHRAALEKLGEAYAEDGEPAAAVNTWLRAAELARGEGDNGGLALLRDRIAALDETAAQGLVPDEAEPGHDVDELLDPSDGVEEPAAEVDEAPQADDESDLEFDDDIEIDIDADDLDDAEPQVEVAAPEVEVADAAEESSEAATVAGPGVSSSTSQQIQEELEEGEFYHQQGLMDEARVIYQRVLELAPNHPLALARMGELGASGAPADGAAEVLVVEADVDIDAGEDESTEDVGHDLAEWSADDLAAEIEIEDPGDEHQIPVPDEVGNDVAGPGDTTPELDLDAPGETDPIEADSDGDTTDVEVQPAAGKPAPQPEPAPLAAAEGADFDLAAELRDALDDAPETSSGSPSFPGVVDDGFAAVFREFKKGVSKTLGEGDHEAHWDLGIAYREMGLLEDALGEFELALTSPDRRIGALHMVALCALDLGRADDAAARLEEALGSGGLGDEQKLALRFDLGRTYEAQGRIPEARRAWEAVAEVNAGFCEVGERLAALSEVKPDPDPTQEYESFTDLIGEEGDDDPAAASGDAAVEAHESFEDLIAEASEEPESAPAPAAEPEVAADPDDSGSTDPGAPGSGKGGGSRRKKKISFI